MSAAGGTWERFCIVGLGGHARTKLIPAILANRQALVGIVSRRPAQAPADAPLFDCLETVLAALPPDTAFVLATPPALHFEQACLVLDAGRDLVVEKPAFVTEAQAREAARRCQPGSVLVEAFMHRHTGLFQRLLACWAERRDEIEAIDIFFLIPAVPPGTFRQEAEISSSLLYDIGCYAASLLVDLGLPLDALDLVDVAEPARPDREAFVLAGELTGVRVSARIGVSTEYRNEVALHMGARGTVRFRPFFYGRPGEKRIEWSEPAAEAESFADGDAFRAMFAVPRERWLASQPGRLERTIESAKCLERLGQALAAWRRSAAGGAML